MSIALKIGACDVGSFCIYKCGIQKVVKVCSTLCNQIRTQCEKTSWKFDVMWVVSLEVKVCKSS